MPERPGPGSPDGRQAAQVQQAAQAAITAARAFLDLAEQLIADPEAMAAVVSSLGSWARSGVAAVSDLVGPSPARPSERIEVRGDDAAGD